MKLPFKQYHLLLILNEFNKQKAPLDVFSSTYFRKNKAIGSKDRKYISNMVYNMTRWNGLIEYFCTKPITNEKKIKVFENLNISQASQDKTIKEHIRCSFPEEYYSLIKEEYKDNAIDFCLTSNTKAPTTIRVNLLKTTRDKLFDVFKKNYKVKKCKFSNFGIIFEEKINFFALKEFKDGLFEIQDEGSQIISDLINLKKDDLVLDYCAGSGGKTLAFAHKAQNKGQFFLHDVRSFALKEAKKRLKRASIENAQFKNFNDSTLKLLKNKIDWLVLDVPCSGSGTLRRNPDMKWKFKKENLDNLVSLQKEIFDLSFSYVKKGGFIAYFTCSIFSTENENQVKYFLKNYPIKLDQEIIRLPVTKDGMDGFFAAIFKKL
ncbi:MAG: Ribosomal RNA small subunit methyltransferase B [Candidatus Anoxychlamydiales bacterium]|nr:Ribosomal RNA small subunit methyltransferase B [Candidatus Anoxychlamydiales bacterium]